ncbi:hypothetical protein IMY05_002G0011500 [Salix suchowensis]|nr:hypothetical protein IMY05_002G0011500 [Salix suchowensis]
MNSPSFLSRGRILHKSVATMGNFSALTLISDECFHNKSNLYLPAVDSLLNKASNHKRTGAPVEEGDVTVLLLRVWQYVLCERQGTAPTPTTVEAYKQTEAQVEEGNASALLPTKPCKTEKNCEFPHARLEEWISTVLLPHQLFEEASSYESVEDHKQTEAQVEESRNAQLLPHPVFKKANNCESAEAHKQTKRNKLKLMLKNTLDIYCFPMNFSEIKYGYGLESSHTQSLHKTLVDDQVFHCTH